MKRIVIALGLLSLIGSGCAYSASAEITRPHKKSIFFIDGVPGPDSIDNLEGWWKSNAGIFQESGCSTPAVSNGDPVGCWQTQAIGGTGADVLQVTSSKRPTYETGAFGFRPAIVTDDVDDFLHADIFDAQKVFSFFIIFKSAEFSGHPQNPSFASRWTNAGGVAGVFFLAGINTNDVTQFDTAARATWVGGLTTLEDDNPHLMISTRAGDSDDVEIFQGTTSRATGTGGVVATKAVDFNINGFGLSPTQAALMTIAEVGLYSVVIDAAAITMLATYAVDEYGVTLP